MRAFTLATWLMTMVMLPVACAAPNAPTAHADYDEDSGLEIGVNTDPNRAEDGLSTESAFAPARVRLPIRWADVEPSPGEFRWDLVESALGDAESKVEAGAKRPEVLVTVHTSPAWARSGQSRLQAGIPICEDPGAVGPEVAHFGPPDDPEDLVNFIDRLVSRHPGRINVIEVWREPNILPNWHPDGPDAEAYADMLEAVTFRMRQTQPFLRIVSAAPAPVAVEALPWCYMADTAFLRRLSATGVLDRLDAVGIQARGFDASVTEAPDENQLNFRRAELLHSIAYRGGVRRPLWALSFGWPSAFQERAAFGPAENIPFEAEEGARYQKVREAAAFENLEAVSFAQAHWPWLEHAYLVEPGIDAFDLDVQAHSLERIAEGALPAPAPMDPHSAPAMSGRRMGLIAGLLAGLAIAIWALGLRQFSEAVYRLVAPIRRWSTSTVLIGALVLLVGNVAAPTPISLLCLLGLAVLGTVRLEAIVFLVSACLPFFYAFNMRVGPRPVQTVELLILLGVAGFIVWARLNPARHEPTRQPVAVSWADGPSWARMADLAVVALLFWSMLSPAWAERPEHALFEWRTVLLEPILFYGLLRSARAPRRMAAIALLGAAAGGLAAALYGLLGSVLPLLGLTPAWATSVAAEGVVRARGPYGSPNNLALALGRVIPILLVAAWMDIPKLDRRVRAAARVGLPIVILAMIATFSRGAALLGLPALVGYTLWLVKTGTVDRPSWLGRPGGDARMGQEAERGRGFGDSRLVVATVLAMGLIAAAALYSGLRTERFQGAFDLSTPGGTGYIRLRLWESSVEMIRDQPILGVGLDNFHYAYRDQYVQRSVLQERSLSHPHNLVLDWWTRLGLPGLLLLVALTMAPLIAALTVLRRKEAGADTNARALAAVSVGMMVYALAHGLIDNQFFLVDLASYAWIAQACILAATVPRAERAAATPTIESKP